MSDIAKSPQRIEDQLDILRRRVQELETLLDQSLTPSSAEDGQGASVAAVLDQLPVGYGLLTPTGHLEAANAVLRKLLLGASKESERVLGCSLGEWLSSASQGAFQEFLANLAQAGRSDAGADVELVGAEGKRLPAELRGTAIRDSSDNLRGIHCTIQPRDAKRHAAAPTPDVGSAWERSFNAVADLISILDPQQRIVRVNQAMADRLGMTPAECVGQTCYRCMHDAGEPPEVCPHKQMLTEHRKVMREVGVDRLGAVFQVTATPFFDAHGELAGSVHIARDITERKRAEEALRDSEERFRRLSGAAFEGIVIHRDGRLLDCNETLARMFGYEFSEMMGMDAYLLGAPEFRELLKRYVREGREESYEVVGLRRDGRRFPAEVIGKGVRYEGAPARVVAIRDITERKRVEEALRESTTKLSALAEEQQFILDHMKDFVYRHDVLGRFFYLSPAVERITGYTVEEWKRHFTAYMTDSPINEQVAANTERTLRTGEAGPPYLVEIRHKNGSPIILEVSERPYQEEGRVVGMVGVARNVTERQRAEAERRTLEAQMQQSQKLESLGILAGGIAHDFNNLLVGIVGNTLLALEGTPKKAAMRPLLEKIDRAAQRATDLTHQLLAYSGRGRFVVEAVDLSQVVAEMIDLLEASISKKADLHCTLPEGLPLIEADATQVRQVVMNLITNASDALGERSGKIVVRTGVMPAEAIPPAAVVGAEPPRDGTHVLLEVIDSGCGMGDQARKRMFEPFFTTKVTGRGLGLAAVLGIVRGHGGTVHVESAADEGTSFRVMFPVAEGGRELPAVRRTSVPRGAADEASLCRGTVLVVDDEELVRAVAQCSLERAGFDVLTAEDGEAALDVFREHYDQVDAVLLDLRMPRFSGEEVFRTLRRLRPELPILLSSGYNEQELDEELSGAVSAGFIQKPYTPDGLVKALCKVLQAR